MVMFRQAAGSRCFDQVASREAVEATPFAALPQRTPVVLVFSQPPLELGEGQFFPAQVQQGFNPLHFEGRPAVALSGRGRSLVSPRKRVR
jgi:hypothetical protein